MADGRWKNGSGDIIRERERAEENTQGGVGIQWR